ncbi:N-acetyllactosaminide beta-1,3-N-acetylglucosaminyltransferase 2 isoform X2 [Acinonyx jubatus]|uniref:N-acetyllactosaminide beta-1,3-N-acetylglucosaminyltransferase 2 isoform X2 n=1 Tax=Acinonyx jubatus TaxID=32536 RepID=A0ABM3NB24_ACIJB|nr:N-acetyllactosaminide beta-1,3-N-acetylglucosaminyltransferase 2 isoform X2 [Acinonyx jubatus]
MPRQKASYLFHVSRVLLLLLQQQLHFTSLRKVLPPGTLSFRSVQIPACPQCGARWEARNPGVTPASRERNVVAAREQSPELWNSTPGAGSQSRLRPGLKIFGEKYYYSSPNEEGRLTGMEKS